MSKVTLPKPDIAAIIYARTGLSATQFPDEYTEVEAACEEYAEAYAAAKVREALEEAARLCEKKYELRADGGFPREASTARALAEQIRALKVQR